MATLEEQVEEVLDLLRAGDYDQAANLLREGWSALWLAVAGAILVSGAPTASLVNGSIAESWDLTNEPADSFGASWTYVDGVPDVDLALLTIVTTTPIVPAVGYIWHIRNSSLSRRLEVVAEGGALFDGAGEFRIPPSGDALIAFDGTSLRVLCRSWSSREWSIPLGDTDTAGGLITWQNESGLPGVVSLVIDVHTQPGSGSMNADFGVSASIATADNLLDGVLIEDPAVFSSLQDSGVNGRAYRRIAVGEYVTGTTVVDMAAGLSGNVLLSFVPSVGVVP